jgi:hypothetical protein
MPLILPVHFSWIVNHDEQCRSRIVSMGGAMRTVRTCGQTIHTTPPVMRAANGTIIPFPRRWRSSDEYTSAASVSVVISIRVPGGEDEQPVMVDDLDQEIDFSDLDIRFYNCDITIHPPSITNLSAAIASRTTGTAVSRAIGNLSQTAGRAAGILVAVCTPSPNPNHWLAEGRTTCGTQVRYVIHT